MFVFALQTIMDFDSLVSILRQIPNMTWTAGIPEIFRNKTSEELHSMLIHDGFDHNTPKVKIVGAPPASVDWIAKNPTCVNIIRD